MARNPLSKSRSPRRALGARVDDFVRFLFVDRLAVVEDIDESILRKHCDQFGRIFAKLDVTDRASAAVKGLKFGLINV